MTPKREQEIRGAVSEYNMLAGPAVREVLAALDAERAENAETVRLLRTWDEHGDGCLKIGPLSWGERGPCTCGLDDAKLHISMLEENRG